MEQVTPTGKPLQRVSWSEKIAKKKEWFKRSAKHYLSLSNFNFDGTKRKNIGELYGVYNGNYPSKWFDHVTNPLNAQDPKHKSFPGKIRPVPMIRTNIDLLYNEYPRRPFVYQVTNTGEDGYNRYTESLKTTIQENLTQHFVAMMQQQALAQGVPVEEVPGLDEIELPDKLKERFHSTYKDAIAVRGQRWMKRAMKEYKIKDEMQRQFKDWLISGMCRSYKGVSHGELIYEKISPLMIDHDKAESLEYIEDGEWAVCKRLWTFSDVVDEFYDDLKESELDNLEKRAHYASPSAFYTSLSTSNIPETRLGKIPVYHIVWKGKKEVKILSYPDPMTGEMQEMEVDEDYPVNKDAGESVTSIWPNEVYETWIIGDDIFVRMQPIAMQRNEMNNMSKCKLPYNGRNYSDLHAENISVLELGLPYQIMYMITNRTLEMTIAKSKGKILLIDKNAIPRGNGWNDEKFFYYAEALGYGLLNRNQIGVDKTFNQYQVVDMGLFDQIENLIQLQDHFKNEWDNILGINRQRKGQTYASDGKATSEMSFMQSSVITDGIFNAFEQFTERELQGILDWSKFVNIDGVKALYNSEDFDTELLDIDPNQYTYAQLGILMNSGTEEYNALNAMKQHAQAFVQAGTKGSTVLEMLRASNVAELKMKLEKMEELQASIDAQIAENEQQAQQLADERKKDFAMFNADLEATLLDKEWDRRDQNTMIKGEYDVYSASNLKGDGDADNNGIPDVNEIEKRVIDRQKIFTDERVKREELATKERIHAREDATRNREIDANLKIAADKHKADMKKASQRPKSSK